MNRSLLLLASALVLSCSSGSSGGSSGDGTDASSGDDTLVASNDSSTPGDDTSGATDSTTGSDADLGPYPSGPYGNAVGATFPNLQWVGHVDDAADVIATSEPVTPYSMDDVRRSGKAYAFVHVSEFY